MKERASAPVFTAVQYRHITNDRMEAQAWCISEDGGAILKRYLALEPITRPYFDVPANAPAEAFQAEVATHPVFRLTPTGSRS